MIRKATAVWNGSGKEGKGHLTTASTVLDKTQYSFNTRFEDGVGTNPEELIAAAHAGCFAMKLSFNLTAVNFPPKELDVTSNITFEDGSLKKIAPRPKSSSRRNLQGRICEAGQRCRRKLPDLQSLEYGNQCGIHIERLKKRSFLPQTAVRELNLYPNPPRDSKPLEGFLLPSKLTPILLLPFSQICPSHKSTLFVSLSHLDSFLGKYPGFFKLIMNRS